MTGQTTDLERTPDKNDRLLGLTAAGFRVVVAFMKEFLTAELKRVPAAGGIVSAFEKLSEEASAEELATHVRRLLDLTQSSSTNLESVRSDIELLTELSTAMYKQQ